MFFPDDFGHNIEKGAFIKTPEIHKVSLSSTFLLPNHENIFLNFFASRIFPNYYLLSQGW